MQDKGTRIETRTPAPPRFLPEYDNVLLSHADRTPIVSEDHRRQLTTVNGRTVGTVLLDVCGGCVEDQPGKEPGYAECPAAGPVVQ